MVVSRKCGICQAGCQVNVTIEDGKIVRVKPDKTMSNGSLCPRGAIATEYLYGSERLTYPLIRNGEKGEGKFRRATWDEAIEYAATLIKSTIEQYGAHSIGSYAGRGVRGMAIQRLMTPGQKECLLERLGSPNSFSCGSICWFSAGVMAPLTTLGLNVLSMYQDIEHCDYIFIWGQNPVISDGSKVLERRIRTAKERGAKVVVIDPRQKGVGEIADLWIPIIPGTDGALALAMHKIIIEQKYYDEEFVCDFTFGFEEFKSYLDTLTLEELADFCGISIEIINKLTAMFVSTQKVTLLAFTGVEYQPSAVQNHRAVLALWGLTGKFDVEGSIYLDAQDVNNFKCRTIEGDKKPIGYDEFPLFTKISGYGQFSRVPKAVICGEPYLLRGLIVVGGSPTITFPDSKIWRKAYQKLECLIVCEQYPSEDMRFADVVFPACTGYETYRNSIDSNGQLVWDKPVIAPVGECREDVLILSAIAKKLGCAEGYPETMEEFAEWLETPTSVVFPCFHTGHMRYPISYQKYKKGLLRADGQPGFPTVTGKFEICSTLLKENGYVAYPEYTDIRMIPGMYEEEYPFVLTTGAKSIHRMSAVGTNIPAIAKMEPYPFADISANDAEELGITEGEWIKVITPNGVQKFKTHISAVMKRCINIPYGGGSDYMSKQWKEGNANELTTLDVNDPISGYATMKCAPCRIEKCEKYEL